MTDFTDQPRTLERAAEISHRQEMARRLVEDGAV